MPTYSGARAAGYAWCTVPEADRAGGYTHLRDHEEFINLSLYGTCGFYGFNNDDSRVHYTFIIGLANLWPPLNLTKITSLPDLFMDELCNANSAPRPNAQLIKCNPTIAIRGEMCQSALGADARFWFVERVQT